MNGLLGCESKDSLGDRPLVNSREEIAYQHAGLTKYNPAVELTFVRGTSENLEALVGRFPGETLADNRWSRLYYEVLGIDIKYDWIAEVALFDSKLATDLVSGNLPDVSKVNAQQMRELTNAGFIQDLSTAYEIYATPFTKEVMRQEGTAPFEAATIDDKLMGIPDIQSSIEGTQFLWIRTDWLDQLDLTPPETMKDVLAISKAFTEQDPNQTGEDDTYGLALSNHLFDPVLSIIGFMAGYGAYPNIWIEDESGDLVYGGIQEEVKEALQVLQDMYKHGQLDSEFVFKDGNKMKEQVVNGSIGMLYGEQWSSFFVEDSRQNNPNAEWKPFPIVSNSGELPKVPLSSRTDYYWVVREGYEHPEALIKLINLHLEKNWGETAEYEIYYSTPYPAWQLSPITPYPVLKNLEAYRQIEHAVLTGKYSELTGEAKAIYMNMEDYLLNDDDTGWGWVLTYGFDGAFSILEQYMNNDQLLIDEFVWAPTDTMLELQPILYNRQLDIYQNIILGSPISQFDEFVEDWERMGGAKITEEVNKIYKERKNK
ncbi:putative aldouronate transport system substrate-binding protein [Evansella caseinilytica]|uniref:Putative aldouronate transport system substrate-binding protein n=1 Tax=Evansella caseinilytica TaxID=1503961 RepID=A0A1H3NTW5_9BACI|nr:putative aldouronate transport system substrate-binding protein [Evansella caseinilytica]